jgi:peptide/nickel transport system substrate-binding protein
MRKTRKVSFILVIILLLTSLIACSSSNSTQSKDNKKTAITIARPFDISGLDPGFLTENAQVVDNIFGTLVKRDNNEKLIPGLATSWKQINDTTWEFNLRKGVKFSNGESFNANAVKFSIDRVLNPKNNAPTISYISTIKKVKIINDYKVQIITKGTDPLIPSRFNRYPTEIVPPKYTQKVGQKTFSQHPIGTGPYKLAKWKKGESVVLTLNNNYWDKKPQIKKVTFRSIPDSSTRVSALLNGEADIVTSVPPEELSRIKGSSKARVSTVKRGGNTVYVGIKTNQKPFNNLKVRQALNYAVNVPAIVKGILNNAAVTTNSLIGPKDFGYAGELKGYEYNPKKAKQLLREAGYPHGFSTTIDTVNWYLCNTDVAQAIAQNLEKVGIKVKVKNVENSVYRTTVPAHKQSPLYVLGWSSTNTLDADAAIYAVLHSNQPYSTYSNSKVDKLLDEARSSTDNALREKLYAEVEKIVIKDAPRIFLYQENQYYGVAKNLQWDGRIDGNIPVNSITNAN